MLIEFDESAATASQAVDRLQELDRLLSRLHAIQADLLVAAADPQPQELEIWVGDDMTDAERRLLIEDPIRDELAAALHRSSLVMQRMIETARWLAGPLRPTWQALHEGRITMSHVWILEGAARDLPEELLPQFQAKVLPRACERTLANTRRAVRETVHRLDREGCQRRRRQAIGGRDVWLAHEPDGTSLLMARLATERALAVMTQIAADAHDRAFAVDCPAGMTLGQHRADVLADLVLGGRVAGRDDAGAVTVASHLNLTLPLDTLLALQDDAGTPGTVDLEGVGAVTVDLVRDLLADPECELTMRRLVTDPITGHLLDRGRKTYAIPRVLREFIIARDRTCRFPGCNRRADLCEVDHATAWDDGGETTTENLGALCKRHHQLKTHSGWDITESRPDGTCTWRSPQGRTYVHRPDEIGSG